MAPLSDNASKTVRHLITRTQRWWSVTAVVGLTILTLFTLLAAWLYLQSLFAWLGMGGKTAVVPNVSPPTATATWQPPSPMPTVAIATPQPSKTPFPTDATHNFSVVSYTFPTPQAPITIAPITVAPTSTATAPPAPPQLLIPSLGVASDIVPILVHDGQWDVSTLGTQVGLLQTTGAYPGDAMAMSFVGHVTLRSIGAGPFVGLIRLHHGDEIIYRWQGTDYIYAIDLTYLVPPEAVHRLYVPNGDRIVVTTCSGWDFIGRQYEQRLVLQATLIRKTHTPVLQPSNAYSSLESGQDRQ
jgi:sortase (surface protein transpeptidase)